MTRLVLLVLSITFALLAGCSHQSDSDARRRELATAILKETGALQLATDSAHASVVYWRKSRSDVPDDFWDQEVKDLESAYASEMMESYIHAYANELTETELGELYDYLQTPVGKKFAALPRRLAPTIRIGTTAAYESFLAQVRKRLVANGRAP